MIAGVDEVGRGCIAGPVVAAAVILQANIEGIKDSKKLSIKKRNELSELIKSNSIYSFGMSSSDEIDELVQKVLTKCSQYPNKEIPSREIGEIIMREIIKVDQVAYLRFASVYLSFNDVRSFKSIIENLEKQPSPSMLKNQNKIEIDD